MIYVVEEEEERVVTEDKEQGRERAALLDSPADRDEDVGVVGEDRGDHGVVEEAFHYGNNPCWEVDVL